MIITGRSQCHVLTTNLHLGTVLQKKSAISFVFLRSLRCRGQEDSEEMGEIFRCFFISGKKEIRKLLAESKWGQWAGLSSVPCISLTYSI